MVDALLDWGQEIIAPVEYQSRAAVGFKSSGCSVLQPCLVLTSLGILFGNADRVLSAIAFVCVGCKCALAVPGRTTCMVVNVGGVFLEEVAWRGRCTYTVDFSFACDPCTVLLWSDC